MLLKRVLIAIVVALSAGSASGQYYLFDANEYGASLEAGYARTESLESRGVSAVIKSGKRSGVALSWAEQIKGGKIRSYAINWEYLFTRDVDDEFEDPSLSGVRAAPLISLGIGRAEYPGTGSALSLTPSLGLWFTFPIGGIGRNMFLAAASAWLPFAGGNRSAIRYYSTIASTQELRLSSSIRLSLGMAYVFEAKKRVSAYEYRAGFSIIDN